MNERRRQLRNRLRRLGKQPRNRASIPRPAPTAPPSTLEERLGGRVRHTERGSYFLVEHCLPLEHQHGPYPLARILQAPRDPLRELLTPAPEDPPAPTRFLFLDTETTGLARGAGTYVFLVGVGRIDGDRFCVRQYFLRDLDEEPAMLADLVQHLNALAGVVTFNGRTFDLPLLATRLVLNRISFPLDSLPHLDLLPITRRLWRARLGQCSLNHVERHLLGHRRDQNDIPGWLVPILYRDYLRTRDPALLEGIFYHNLHDILSMVSLADVILRVWHDPWAEPLMQPEDFISWARWLLRSARVGEAEAALRHALRHLSPGCAREQAFDMLTRLLKRQRRWAEARRLWEQWVEESPTGSLTPYEELAKYYEWVEHDPQQALAWVRRAWHVWEQLDRGGQLQWEGALRHREQRLQGKIQRRSP